MKKATFLFVTVLLIVGCDNPVNKKIKETKQNVSNTTSAYKELSTMGDDIKELQEVEPLTNEELKAWLPDEINGMKRTGYKAGQTAYIQIAQVEATYATEDKLKEFRVQVIDGAGQMGASATAGFRMMMSQDFEEEDEYRVRKTSKRDGYKTIEEYRKKDNNSEIQLMQDKRFYIKAYGKNMDLDETWDAIEEMDVEDLT